jgi:hypothetical protein
MTPTVAIGASSNAWAAGVVTIRLLSKEATGGVAAVRGQSATRLLRDSELGIGRILPIDIQGVNPNQSDQAIAARVQNQSDGPEHTRLDVLIPCQG